MVTRTRHASAHFISLTGIIIRWKLEFMPYLTLDTPPPTSKDVRTTYSLTQRRSQDADIHSTPLASSDCTINGSKVLETSNVTNIYPLMKLDTERITDAIAGRLATSLLAHVLFLKNQVPLYVTLFNRASNNSRICARPITQLGRLSSAKVRNHLDIPSCSSVLMKTSRRLREPSSNGLNYSTHMIRYLLIWRLRSPRFQPLSHDRLSMWRAS